MKSRTGNQTPSESHETSPAIVYCICRKPDSGKWMIGCDGCDDWFHGECVDLLQEDEDLVDQYFCPTCQQRGLGATTWKRKCRLPNCHQPARTFQQPPSKYCCMEHGVLFFQSKREDSEYNSGELATVIRGLDSSQAFKSLGEPARQRRNSNIGTDSDSQHPRLHQVDLSVRRSRLHRRSIFVGLAKERQKRIGEDLRGDVEQSAKGARDICGYDARLALDDQEFEHWCGTEEGQGVFAQCKIEGKDSLCLKRKCDKHKYWLRIAMEDMELEERLINEEEDGIL